MFFACGLSAYSASIFHLLTHAFFKALLFLSAGCVIHAIADEQNMGKMGGLIKKLPYTYVFIWIGSLALAGIPPFSGYFSKDLIIEYSFATHTSYGLIVYLLGNIAALFTAFYSWRLIFLTFHGKYKNKLNKEEVHEAPIIMLIPLILLALCAIFSGFLFINFVENNDFWINSIYMRESKNILEVAHHIPLWAKLVPLILALIGIMYASSVYLFNKSLISSRDFKNIYNFLLNKWYFDEVYNIIFIRSSKKLGKFLWLTLDQNFIDKFGPNGISSLIWTTSSLARKLQTGKVFHYAFVMFIGIIVILTWQLIIYTTG